MLTTTATPTTASAIAPSPLVVSRALGTVVVALRGEIDAATSPFLETALRDLIEGQGNQTIMVDLTDLRRLSDSAIETLVAAAHTSRRQGGRLAIRRPSGAVAKALQAAGWRGRWWATGPHPASTTDPVATFRDGENP